MKKITLLVLPALLVIGFWISVFSSPVQAFTSGSGVSGDPYVVLTADDLNRVRNNLDAHYIQGADIDLSDYSLDSGWEPIGTSSTPFEGTFDGNHYRITGLVINSTASANIGLFGYTSQSTIQNVGLEKIDIKSSASTVSDVGGLVGRGSGTFINNYTSGNLEITVPSHNSNNSKRVGGLIGLLYDDGSQISNSYSTVHVTTNVQDVGGLVGFLDHNTLIEKSYATGNVRGYWQVGGLTGAGYNISGIRNSYATGDVQVNSQYGGGLFGIVQKPVHNNFAVGKVSGGTNMGAFAGTSYGSVSSYWNKTANSSLPAAAIGTDSSVGLTESEMKQQASFVGFDFVETWGINEGHSYPYLRVFAPVVRVDDLSPTPYQQGSILTVTGEMRDGSIGQEVTVHYEILDDAHQLIASGSQKFAAATGGYEPYSFSVMLDETKFPGGNYTVNVMAEDSAGKVSYERFVAFDVLSSNADLSELTVSPGTLSPSFSPTEDTFILNVGNDIASLTVIATADDPLAKVEISGMASALISTLAQDVNLTVGSNVIPVVVTAADGVTTKTYTITVTRAGSNDATLKSLTVSEGVLSPAFTLNEDDYTVSVDNTVSSLDVTAIPTDSNATVTVNGSATTSDTITLTVGQSTTIPIVVTAEDGGEKTYTVTIQAATIPVTKHTLFFVSDGVEVSREEVVSGETTTVPTAPKKAGHRFDGWYKEPDFKTPWDFGTSIVADTTLYAKWVVIYNPPPTPTPNIQADMKVDQPLSEEQLDGSKITITVSDTNFVTSLLPEYFGLQNAPKGLTVSEVKRLSPWKAEITFAFDGTKLEEDLDFGLMIHRDALTSDNNLVVSNKLLITKNPNPDPTPELEPGTGKPYKIIKTEGTFETAKVWTVKLSNAVDASIVQDALYIVDAEGDQVPVTFTSNGNTIFIYPPAGGYAQGVYTLYVTSQLKDISGQALQEPIKMIFTVKAVDEPEIDETYKVIVKEGTFPSDKTWTVKFSAEIDESTVGGALLLYDEKGNSMPVIFTSEGTDIIIQAPVNGYAPGTYKLYIMGKLKDISGKELKEPIKMIFTVQ